MDHIKESIAQVFDEISQGLQSGSFGKRARVGITLEGSEHGPGEMLRGATLAQAADPSIEVVVIGEQEFEAETELTFIEAADQKTAHELMDKMLLSGELDAAVTMHYNFPIGVATVGRVITPGFGRKMFVGTTTGTSDTERTSAMLKNAIGSIAAAKACGIAAPTVGILNIEGARGLERALIKLQESGYPINFTQSARADGGVVMRGNDLLQGVPDIMVMDSLTGNVIMKAMSAFSTGGSYESLGDGYGPGIGESYDRIINIISRASGAPVVAGAITYAGALARGQLLKKVANEYAMAKKAGLGEILAGLQKASEKTGGSAEEEVKAPPEKIVTEEIPGIEILELEDAVRVLWKLGIFASSGMGCTGPIILVAPEDKEAADKAIKEAGYL
ncbi:MAG: glycine/sarcosine/betaine reductase complex component C subunit alpha [Oscillospiraceae bacterium]|nr:glycine/sarcosine/betaine reductase complex component C subunit alpha [Oscillospiraceae bacterium]